MQVEAEDEAAHRADDEATNDESHHGDTEVTENGTIILTSFSVSPSPWGHRILLDEEHYWTREHP